MYVHKQDLYGMMMGHIKLLSIIVIRKLPHEQFDFSIIVICKLPHEQFDLVNNNNMTF